MCASLTLVPQLQIHNETQLGFSFSFKIPGELSGMGIVSTSAHQIIDTVSTFVAPASSCDVHIGALSSHIQALRDNLQTAAVGLSFHAYAPGTPAGTHSSEVLKSAGNVSLQDFLGAGPMTVTMPYFGESRTWVFHHWFIDCVVELLLNPEHTEKPLFDLFVRLKCEFINHTEKRLYIRFLKEASITKADEIQTVRLEPGESHPLLYFKSACKADNQNSVLSDVQFRMGDATTHGERSWSAPTSISWSFMPEDGRTEKNQEALLHRYVQRLCVETNEWTENGWLRRSTLLTLRAAEVRSVPKYTPHFSLCIFIDPQPPVILRNFSEKDLLLRAAYGCTPSSSSSQIDLMSGEEREHDWNLCGAPIDEEEEREALKSIINEQNLENLRAAH